MSSDRDVPDDDLEDVTPEERARATSLARLVDAMLEGQAPPPALEANSRALLETATAIRAGLGNAELAPDRKRRIVDGALTDGKRERPAEGGELIAFPRPSTAPPLPVAATAVTPLVRPGRLARHAPWAVAALSLAAAIMLFIRPPARPVRAPHAQVTPTSVLIGAIPHDQAGNARSRIDAIYADRLSMYRSAHFGGGER